MPSFDFDRALKWARLGRTPSLARRDQESRSFLTEAGPGSWLLLDSCVYIDRLQGRLPPLVSELLDTRLANHTTVALAEMMYLVGRLDPADSRSRQAIEQIGTTIALMKPHRLFEPDTDTVGRAALLGGVLSRVQGYQKDDRLRAINDCTIFLQAAKLGLTVLSRNVRDFDLLLQLIPAGRVLFYR